MSSQQLVLALFEDEAAADVAAESVQNWAERTQQAKISAVGVLAKDEKGKIKTHKLGHSRAGAGAVLFGLAAFLTGGLTLGLGGVAGSALIGGGLGSLFHKGLKISKEDKERLNQALDGGNAAVGVMIKEGKPSDVAEEFVKLGGQAETYEVPEDAMEEIQSVADDATDESAEDAS